MPTSADVINHVLWALESIQARLNSLNGIVLEFICKSQGVVCVIENNALGQFQCRNLRKLPGFLR